MNWDAIGAIGEMVGATGVIASLLYLAVQIRRDRQNTRAHTRAMLAAIDVEDLRSIRDNDRLLESMAKDLDLDEPDAVERLRFSLFIRGLARAAENHFYQYRLGTLDEEEFEGQRKLWKGTFSHPRFRQWWDDHKGDYSLAFQRELSGLLEKPDDDWWNKL